MVTRWLMGTLVVKHYPTKLFAQAADHTYVECGTGAVSWSCWGGSQGGAVLRQSTGSTQRADSIAQPNERAGVTCYLINGVCHQAANRILLPAGITVNGARGYQVSQGMFGPYGRVGRWPCRAPFNQNIGVTGDIAACLPPPGVAASAAPLSGADQVDRAYILGALAIYEQFSGLPLEAPGPEGEMLGAAVEFQMSLFEYMLEFRVGAMLDDAQKRSLLDVRHEIELRRIEIEPRQEQDGLLAPEFVEEFNRLTIEFQQRMGNEMTDTQYETLFQLRKDELVVLADPAITNREPESYQ
jgi:hypothetical protein